MPIFIDCLVGPDIRHTLTKPADLVWLLLLSSAPRVGLGGGFFFGGRLESVLMNGV